MTEINAHSGVGAEEQAGFWLSVLVPMFNVEAFLDQCLQSIITQADPGVEIVICDDCSPDRSRSIAQTYVDRYPQQVRMIRHAHNRGISATRNSLLDVARGAYVWFIDSDDWLRPGAIAAIARVVRCYAPDLIGGDYRKGFLHKFAFSGRYGRLLTDRDRIAGGICGSRKMYTWLRIARRELWANDLRFPEGRVFEDAAVIPWLALRARSYFHIGRELVQYRVRSGSIMAGVKNPQVPFDLAAHLDLAHALKGFTHALDREDAPFACTRFGVSHFIAMEFAKTVARIKRAGQQGGTLVERQALIREFRTMMEQSSPITFDQLNQRYLRSGRLIAWMQLRKAMA